MAYKSMPNPDVYAQAVRNGVAVWYTVNATYGGNPVAGATGMRPIGGSVTDTTKAGVRRTLNLELAPEPGLFDKLAPIGTRLTVTANVRYTNQAVVTIPMGVFDVDSQTLREGAGSLSLTAPDLWVLLQRAKFPRPVQSIPGLSIPNMIAWLIRDALGQSTAVAITSGVTSRTGNLTWEKDRDKAITDLADSAGLWVYADRNGGWTVADFPTIGRSANWLIDASPSGVLTSLDRTRSRTNTYNVVIVSSSSTDTADVFDTQTVWDTDPNSPTYAGTDPFGHPELAGPFGVVPYYHDTPLALGNFYAKKTGWTILSKTAGLASSVNLGQVPNPAVDAGDVIDVMPPKVRYDQPRILERHMADEVTHPLSGEAQQITGRSTRTDPYQ